MYFIPKYLRYSVGTEEICFSAKQRGARGADMDLAELSELLHRGNGDDLDARVPALPDQRLAQHGVGVVRHIDRGDPPGLQRLENLLGPDELSIGMQPFRHSDTSMADTRKYAGRPTQIWIIAEITNRVNKKSRKTKINFSFFPAAPAFFALWQNEQRKSRSPPCLMPAIRNFYPAPACRAGAGYVILSCKTPMERTIFPCNMM